MRRAFLSAVFLLTFLLTLTVGCGGSGTIPVTGKILWDDGTPISGVGVRFVPLSESEGRDALGATGANGEFTLTTFVYNDGAKPGEYTVVLTKVEKGSLPELAPKGLISPEEMTKRMKEFNDRKPPPNSGGEREGFPSTYGNAKSSPIKWKVDSSHTKPEFKIPKP